VLDHSSIITTASTQWANRPDDERFVSLHDLYAKVSRERETSIAKVISNRRILAQPTDDHQGLEIHTAVDKVTPTNWSFGQLASLAKAPAGYLRTLPSDLTADLVNYGLRHARDVEEIGLLMGPEQLRAATGPNYGRIWNADLVSGLIDKFGDGVTGDWKVPGEFGVDVPVTKRNTTIYGSDREVWVFLADEKHRVEVPNRRNGETGLLSRGFFVWNSEVGSSTIGGATFYFDYVCMNRIIWGAEGFQERRFRHTAGAPDRWLEEIEPLLAAYSTAGTGPIEAAIAEAQKAKLEDDFLAKRFGKTRAEQFKAAFEREEGRPPETIWDGATAITAFAKSIPFQDVRVELEREGGKLLDLVAA
jgi:hypothetical protein